MMPNLLSTYLFKKEVGGMVGVPKVVGSLPLEFSGDDWNAAESG